MKSVFEGWTKKIEHRGADSQGGYCAIGYLDMTDVPVRSFVRIGKWIQKNLDPPKEWRHLLGGLCSPQRDPVQAIVWANNECKLDIEGFKMADLLSQGYVPEEHNAFMPEAILEAFACGKETR